jgi:hypothetical protein
MASNIVGGKVFVSVNGTRIAVKGNVTYNLGVDKREAIIGADGVHGFKSMPQVPYIEFETTDTSNLDLKALQSIENGTVVLQKPNGKTVTLAQACYAGEGQAQTEEGQVSCRFEGMYCEESGGE